MNQAAPTGGAARQSLAAWLAGHPEERAAFLSGLSQEEALALKHDWRFWARPAQIEPPGRWRFWIIKPGRGWGKTRTGAETVRRWIESGVCSRVALVNDTAADVRDVMIEGPAGILTISPPWNKPIYEPSKRRLTWNNGAVAICYAAEAPELLRGPEHDGAWCDELAKWKNLQKKDQEGGTAWSNLLFGLRVGNNPRAIITTTPRPIPEFRKLLKRQNVVITDGSSFDNRVNLSDDWFEDVIAPILGTRLARQEVGGELLEDTPGALWTIDRLDSNRVEQAPGLKRIVIAIDPSGSADTERGAECGIVAAGLGMDGHGYVLQDFTDRFTPGEWGALAVKQFGALKADRIIGEKNFGGQMVAHTVRTAAKDAGANVAYKDVNASRGKLLRAEPIAALDEQRRMHIVGSLPKLEDQLCHWIPGMKSPDRLDAMVWALTELMISQPGELRVLNLGDGEPQTEDEKLAEEQERIKVAAAVVMDAIKSDGIFWPGGAR